MIHPNSTRTKHFLAIAEFFIRIGKPDVYLVECDLDAHYRPDAYMVYKGEKICVEVQLTHISTAKMQKKVDNWVEAFVEDKHDCTKMWIVTDHPCSLTVPNGFTVEFHKWTLEKEIIL